MGSNPFKALGGIAGAAGGLILGGGFGGLVKGAVFGSAIGGMLGKGRTSRNNLPTQHGARLGDLRVQLSSYGQVIPTVYGCLRLAGNIIWATNIKEVASEHTEADLAIIKRTNRTEMR